MSFFKNISELLKEKRSERLKMLLALCAGLLSFGVSTFQFYEEKKLKKENQVYEVQLETLSEVQESINNLSAFIKDQKDQLKQSQQAVESLKKEQEVLKPVVEADRQIVDSLLRIQADRAKANVWQERLIGFGLGILGSLIASLIWSAIRRGKNA